MFAKALMSVGIGLATMSGFAIAQDLALPRAELPDIALPGVERTIWPGNVWAVGTMPEATAPVVQDLIDDAMSRKVGDVMGESRQIVVIHRGRVVAEAYGDGFDEETKLVSWSMAKSITQALVGRAVQGGLIEDIDGPMPGPWEADDPRDAITWRQWMTMTDGLEYYEVGETDLSKNDVVQMMFGPGRYDVVEYVKGLPQIHETGTHWNYSTAAYHIISRGLGEILNKQQWFGEIHDEVVTTGGEYEGSLAMATATGAMRVWVDKAFFIPLGMDAQPEFDASGTFLGGSLVYASARDFARFGYLYLRDGVWEGERLLPEGWVDFATTAHPGTDTNVYGAGWWITPEEGETPTHAQSAITGPYDAFHAGGNEGQTIWVVPSKDLVIVRLGLMSNAPENWRALYEWNQEIARAF